MQQWTGLNLGKEYNKAIYCHPAYLIYIQTTSRERPDWMNPKMEPRLFGEISIISDIRHHPYGRKQRGTKRPLDQGERRE